MGLGLYKNKYMFLRVGHRSYPTYHKGTVKATPFLLELPHTPNWRGWGVG